MLLFCILTYAILVPSSTTGSAICVELAYSNSASICCDTQSVIMYAQPKCDKDIFGTLSVNGDRGIFLLKDKRQINLYNFVCSDTEKLDLITSSNKFFATFTQISVEKFKVTNENDQDLIKLSKHWPFFNYNEIDLDRRIRSEDDNFSCPSSNFVGGDDDDDKVRIINSLLLSFRCSNKNLTVISITIPSSVLNVHLGHNAITYIGSNVFSNCINLNSLFMAFNKLSILNNSNLFSNATKITQIYLQNNQLTYIREGLFNYLTNLQVLVLNNNILSSIDIEVFSLINLQILSVNMNQLEKVYNLSSKHIQLLDFSDNKIREIPKGFLTSCVDTIRKFSCQTALNFDCISSFLLVFAIIFRVVNLSSRQCESRNLFHFV